MEVKNRKSRARNCVLCVLSTLTLLSAQKSWGQFEDEDFPLPPPPPALPGDNGSTMNNNPYGTPPPASAAQQNYNSQSNLRGGLPPKGAPTSQAMGATAPAKNSIEDRKAKLANAGIEDMTNENFPDTIESFDFPNAEITDLAKAISELTGKNFIVDPGVRGKISIIAPSKITVAEAYKAFLSSLAINGFAVVPSGKFLKIRSARNAQRDGVETYSGSYYPNADQMITRIVHLKHLTAESVNSNLRILNSKDGELSFFPPTNSLIISDYGSNIDRIMRIINQLDVPGFDDQMDIVPVRFAKAKDIAELVNKIVNKGDTKNQQPGGFAAGVPRFSRPMGSPGGGNTGGSSSAYFLVFPDDRTNSLIVVGNKPGIQRVHKLVSQLDFRIRPDENGGVHVYYLKYGDAEKIQATLTGIVKDTAPKPATGTTGATAGAPTFSPTAGVVAPQEIFGGDVKITADKGTNALVIVASKQDYEVVLNLLNKLDIPRDQVYVETIIMEMNAGDALNWQTAIFNYPDNTGIHQGFNGFDQSTLAGLLNPVGGTGAILGFGTGGTVNINPINLTSSSSSSTTTSTTGNTITLPSLVSLVNFIKTNAHGNVLSTPGVLALDNQEASIKVGDQVVTSSNTTSTATGVITTTPVLSDAAIEMKIKPFISPSSNNIRLEIDSSIKQLSNLQPPPAFASSTIPLATRAIKTSIVVPNSDTAVLGGLMKDVNTETLTKVPLLGDIPVIGWLFKSSKTSKEKQNLVVFLTPTIIRNHVDSKGLLDKKIDQRLGFIKEMGGKDPYGRTIDEIQGITAVKDAEDREAKKEKAKE